MDVKDPVSGSFFCPFSNWISFGGRGKWASTVLTEDPFIIQFGHHHADEILVCHISTITRHIVKGDLKTYCISSFLSRETCFNPPVMEGYELKTYH